MSNCWSWEASDLQSSVFTHFFIKIGNPDFSDWSQAIGVFETAAQQIYDFVDANTSGTYSQDPQYAVSGDYNGSGNKYAVIVGISDYPGAGDLNYAVDNAATAKDALMDYTGVPESNITVLTDMNATGSNVINAIRNSGAGNEDLMIVYLCGHGVEYNGVSNFVVWSDDQINSESISSSELNGIFDDLGSSVVLIYDSDYPKTIVADVIKDRRLVFTAADPLCIDSGGETGAIAFTSIPEGATVYLNHVIQGITPITVVGLPPCTYTYLLVLDKYEGYIGYVDVVVGETTSVHCDLVPLEPDNTLLYFLIGAGIGVIVGIAGDKNDD